MTIDAFTGAAGGAVIVNGAGAGTGFGFGFKHADVTVSTTTNGMQTRARR